MQNLGITLKGQNIRFAPGCSHIVFRFMVICQSSLSTLIIKKINSVHLGTAMPLLPMYKKRLSGRPQSGLTFGLSVMVCFALLPTGSEEREVLGFGSIPVAIRPSCQDMKTIAL